MFRRLEPALNSRDPLSLREDVWWRTLRTVGQEVGLVRAPATAPATSSSAPAGHGPTRTARKKKSRSGSRGDAGQATLETVAILPLTLFVALVFWQLGVFGMSLVWSGHAAGAAARAVSVHGDPAAAARQAIPGGLRDDLAVSVSGDVLTVRLKVPIVAPGLGSFPGAITTTRTVVTEP
jgi:pilus assembly protein CpaE